MTPPSGQTPAPVGNLRTPGHYDVFMLKVVARSSRDRHRTGRLIEELSGSGRYTGSLYLTSDTCGAILDDDRPATAPPARQGLAEILRESRPGETGLCLFSRPGSALAVLPPFPVEGDQEHGGFAPGPLLEMLDRDRTVLVILIRLGHYSVGVLKGDRVVASKSGTRYVKSRHRAGGSSQRRFERSRQRLVREFYDHVCTAAADLIERTGSAGNIEFVMYGGEKGTVRGFRDRCDLPGLVRPRAMSRLLDVNRPGHKAMQSIGRQVYSSALLFLEGASR